jgi:hypothetical protein
MKLDKNSRVTAADSSEQRKADKRRAEFTKKGHCRGYADRPGELRKGNPAFADYPQTAHKPGFESTGADNAGSNSAMGESYSEGATPSQRKMKKNLVY